MRANRRGPPAGTEATSSSSCSGRSSSSATLRVSSGRVSMTSPPGCVVTCHVAVYARARARARGQGMLPCRSSAAAAFLERVQDEVEAVLEGGREVVADRGDVPGDDFGEVGK